MNRQEDKLRKAADYAGMSAETRAAVWRGIAEQMKRELAGGVASDVSSGPHTCDRGAGRGEGREGGDGGEGRDGGKRQTRGSHGWRWRRPGALGSGTAAIAGLAIVAGGLWVASHGGLFGGAGTRTFGASNATTNTPVIRPVGNNPANQRGAASLKLPPSWSRIVVADSSPAQLYWSPLVFTQTEAEVRSLLQSASPVKVTMPVGWSGTVYAHIGPSQLELRSSGQTTTIEPAYYIAGVTAKTSTGQETTLRVKYVTDVIAVTAGQQTNYYRDAAMYDWLKNNAWKAEFQPGLNGNNTQYTDAQLAAMTPSELAAYNVKHGTPLPFAGTMVRNVPSKLLLASDPKSGSILPPQFLLAPGDLAGSKFASYPAITGKPDQFQVVDRWTGSVGSQQGVAVEIDQTTNGSEYIVAIARGPQVNVYSFPVQALITNFTGSYMVFSAPFPAQSSPFYALNLQTGDIMHGVTAAQMSSDYHTISTTIVGLPKSYPSQPVIGGKSY